jgi:hypothetical protein
MPLDYHTLQIADGSTPTSFSDRLQVAFLPNVANAAGAEGAAVTVTLSGLVLPSAYAVHVTPSQAVIVSVPANSKTFSGFSVVLTPLSSTQTIAAGSIDILVTA